MKLYQCKPYSNAQQLRKIVLVLPMASGLKSDHESVPPLALRGSRFGFSLPALLYVFDLLLYVHRVGIIKLLIEPFHGQHGVH